MEQKSQLPTAWVSSLARMRLGIGGGLSRMDQLLAVMSMICCRNQEQ